MYNTKEWIMQKNGYASENNPLPSKFPLKQDPFWPHAPMRGAWQVGTAWALRLHLDLRRYETTGICASAYPSSVPRQCRFAMLRVWLRVVGTGPVLREICAPDYYPPAIYGFQIRGIDEMYTTN